MNVLSLFDGISTGYLALRELGFQIDHYYASEVDKIAIKTSRFNYGNHIEQIGDCCLISPKQLKQMGVDLLIAGSPCQGFSRQGSGLNFEDSRSKLFFVFLRILKKIRQYNPNVLFMLENACMKTEWKDTISQLLGCEPYLINSNNYSAQNRPRLYWTNIEFNIKSPLDVSLKYILQNSRLLDIEYIEHNGLYFDSRFNPSQMDICWMDTKGNVCIKQATKLGHVIVKDYDGITLEFPSSKTKHDRVVRAKSHCIDTRARIGVYYNNSFRYFTLTELERLQTLPDDYTKYRLEDDESIEINTSAQRKRMIGNGWTKSVIEMILSGAMEVCEA